MRITCCQSLIYSTVRLAPMCDTGCTQQPRHRGRAAGCVLLPVGVVLKQEQQRRLPVNPTTVRDELPCQDSDELYTSSTSTHRFSRTKHGVRKRSSGGSRLRHRVGTAAATLDACATPGACGWASFLLLFHVCDASNADFCLPLGDGMWPEVGKPWSVTAGDLGLVKGVTFLLVPSTLETRCRYKSNNTIKQHHRLQYQHHTLNTSTNTTIKNTNTTATITIATTLDNNNNTIYTNPTTTLKTINPADTTPISTTTATNPNLPPLPPHLCRPPCPSLPLHRPFPLGCSGYARTRTTVSFLNTPVHEANLNLDVCEKRFEAKLLSATSENRWAGVRSGQRFQAPVVTTASSAVATGAMG